MPDAAPPGTRSTESGILRRDRVLATTAVLVALGLTLAMWGTLRASERRDARSERDRKADTFVERLSAAWQSSAAGLQSANVLVNDDGSLDGRAFDAFARTLLTPGSNRAVAYIARVTDADRARVEGAIGHRIVDVGTPASPTPAPTRDEYFPVVAVQPVTDGNTSRLGVDLSTDAARGAALRQATSSGAMALTGVVTLQPSNTKGILELQPLRAANGTVAGFVAVAYNASEIGQGVGSLLPAGTPLRITDAGEELWASDPAPNGRFSRDLTVGGRVWHLDLGMPMSVSSTVSTAVLVAGLVATAFVLLVSLWALRARRRSENERDLARALALAISTDEVAKTAANRLPAMTGARAVSVGVLRDGALRTSHSDTTSPQVRQWDAIGLDEDLPFAEAARTGQTVLLRSRAEMDARFGGLSARVRPETNAIAVMPLEIADTVVGAIAFGYARAHRFSRREVAWMRHVAAMVAGAVDRGRLYDVQERIALTLQRSLLPDALPRHDRVNLVATYRPAAPSALVGGDWYDAWEPGGAGCLAVTIGDVTGKGVEAAAAMGKLRHLLRACAAIDATPEVVLSRVNDLVLHGGRLTMFSTACYLTIDDNGSALLASAGHLPAVIVEPTGARLVPTPANPPLGTWDRPYTQTGFRLEPGSTLVLYTDGLVERRGEHLDVSLTRLVETAARLGPDLDVDELAELLAADAQDDVAVIAVRFAPDEAEALGGGGEREPRLIGTGRNLPS